MESKNHVVSDGTIEHAEQMDMTSAASELLDADVILRSVVLLLRHYDNDLGDDSDRPWVGLSLVLEGIQTRIRNVHENIHNGKAINSYDIT